MAATDLLGAHPEGWELSVPVLGGQYSLGTGYPAPLDRNPPSSSPLFPPSSSSSPPSPPPPAFHRREHGVLFYGCTGTPGFTHWFFICVCFERKAGCEAPWGLRKEEAILLDWGVEKTEGPALGGGAWARSAPGSVRLCDPCGLSRC